MTFAVDIASRSPRPSRSSTSFLRRMRMGYQPVMKASYSLMTLQPKLVRYQGPGLGALAQSFRYLMALQRCMEERPENERSPLHFHSCIRVQCRGFRIYDAVVAFGKTANLCEPILCVGEAGCADDDGQTKSQKNCRCFEFH